MLGINSSSCGPLTTVDSTLFQTVVVESELYYEGTRELILMIVVKDS